MVFKKITFLYLAVIVSSCDSGNHIRTYNLPKEKEENSILSTIKKENPPSGLIWEKPNSWIASKGSSMRLASFAIPYTGGSGDLSVIQLGGTGGGIESNINRWRRQLDLESQSWNEIEKNLTSIEGKMGSYSILQIINQKIDSAFICAIIPTENHTIFVKLSLRPIGITEVEDDFIKFTSSLNISN